MQEKKTNKLNSLHHYVPQCYLRNFASRKNAREYYIHRYERNEQTCEPNIKNIAAEKGFYNAQEIETLQNSDMIEEMFAEIETIVSPILQKLRNGNLDLSLDEKGELDYFMTLQYVRTANFRDTQKEFYQQGLKEQMRAIAANPEGFKQVVKKAGITINDEETEDLRLSTLDFDKHFKLELKDGESGLLKTALELSRDLAPCFYMKTIHLAKTRGKSVFITSDNPVILLPQDHLYFKGLLYSTILVPITPTSCLVYHNDHSRKRTFFVSDRTVDKINRCTMTLCNRYVYSNIKSKRIQTIFNSIAIKEKATTTSFINPISSLIITSPRTAPYLVKDIFPPMDVTNQKEKASQNNINH